jgi:hypothetical protein
MIGRNAVAGFAVGGADAVPILRNFQRGPMKFGQGRDKAGYDAGFADATGVSADDESRHGELLAFSS